MKYKILRINSTDALRIYKDQFFPLVEWFLAKSKSQSNLENVFKYITDNIENPFVRLLFVIDEKYRLLSYYLLQIQINYDTYELECFVYQHASKIGIIPEVNERIISDLIKENIKNIKFITKRNSKQFTKKLGKEWKVTGSVIEKRIGG